MLSHSEHGDIQFVVSTCQPEGEWLCLGLHGQSLVNVKHVYIVAGPLLATYPCNGWWDETPSSQPRPFPESPVLKINKALDLYKSHDHVSNPIGNPMIEYRLI